MNLDLARRFLLRHLPPDAHPATQEIFEAIKNDPVTVLNNGILFSATQLFKHELKPVGIAAATGFNSGVALAFCTERPHVCKQLETYIEAVDREKGLNIIDFFQRKKL